MQIFIGDTAALDDESIAKSIVFLLGQLIVSVPDGDVVCLGCGHGIEAFHDQTPPLEDGTGSTLRCVWPKPHVDARICLCELSR